MRFPRVRDLLSRARFEPAHESIFEPRRIGKPPVSSTGQNGYGLGSTEGRRRTWRRREHLELATTDLPALNIDLGPMSCMSITASNEYLYTLDLSCEVACDERSQAEAVLERVALTRERGALRLETPPYLESLPSHTYLDVTAPADRPVVVTGAYSAVELCGMRASITVATSHGRVHLIDTSGHIDVSASEGGWVVFVGNKAEAHLTADLGIDIKVPDHEFHGTLVAKARGPVRVLLPDGFISGFEARVRSRSRFVCRANIGSQLRIGRETGSTVVRHGSELPCPLRFISLQEAVVVDRSA